MHRRSFLHPNHAYTNANTRKLQQDPPFQAPDIFVIPPEEDQIPPWCCYNSQQSLADEDEEDYTLRYPQASWHTPYFHRDAPGIEGLILPTRKGSSETRSIVDALGDADDYPVDEYGQEPMGMALEEDEEDDGMDSEMETDYGETQRRQPCQHQESGVQLRVPLQEVDDDPDVVEIVKVRRKSAFINDPASNLYGPSNGTIGSKSTFRSRASQAFRSLKFGSLMSSSKPTAKSKESINSLSRANTRSKSSLGFRSKTRSKPRAQDIFSPVENVPQPEHTHTPELVGRPSSRISELLPALKRRVSTNSLNSKSPAPHLQTQESSAESSHKKSPSLLPDGSATPPRRSSSSLGHRQNLPIQESDDMPTPTRHSHQRRFEDDEPTPSWRSDSRNTDCPIPPRSISPSPTPRATSPSLSNRQAKKGFSVLNLHKLFQKAASSQPSSEAQPIGQAFSNSSADSTCPSLSSTQTSEWSGRTSPTSDSVPQTPTSFDENEVRRTIVPVQSSSSVGSGISLGSSLQSGAVSCLSPSDSTWSAGTAVTHDSTTAAPGHPSPTEVRLSSDTELPQPSIASSHSVVSTSTAGGAGSSGIGGASQSTISSPTAPSPPPDLAFDMALHLDLDLDLGLNINMTPSESGGMLSTNGLGKAVPRSTLRQKRGRANLGRSLSLKNIGNKLGIGKQDDPPVPPLPRQEDEFEMRLDSLHFDGMSFDADKFMVR